MKAIIVNGKIISICEKPIYVKKHDSLDIYVRCNASEAIGISAGVGEDGGIYNLPGRNDIPDAPEAFVRDDDNREYFFNAHSQADKATKDIINVEDAMCEGELATDERISAIEDVLCELDKG